MLSLRRIRIRSTAPGVLHATATCLTGAALLGHAALCGATVLAAVSWGASATNSDPATLARWTVVVWLAGLLALILPSVQDLIYRHKLGLRAPTPGEARAFAAPLAAACRRVGRRDGLYVLRICDRRGSAWAAGQRIIAVSPDMADRPAAQLEGLFLHEIGHHHHQHGFIALAVAYLSLPIIVCGRAARVAVDCLRVARPATGWLPVLIALPVTLIAIVAALLCWLVAVTAEAAGWSIAVAHAYYSRRCEFVADRFAATHGCADALIEAVGLRHQPTRRQTPLDRLHASHPPNRRRLTALQRHHRRRGTAAPGGPPPAEGPPPPAG